MRNGMTVSDSSGLINRLSWHFPPDSLWRASSNFRKTHRILAGARRKSGTHAHVEKCTRFLLSTSQMKSASGHFRRIRQASSGVCLVFACPLLDNFRRCLGQRLTMVDHA